jgi:haloalkane dehalogenase
MKDIAFREKELRRWETVFPEAIVHRFPEAGHFVQEEQGSDLVKLIETFMGEKRS